MDHNIKTGIRTLWEKAQTAYVGSVDEEGFPQIKAMFVPKQGNIKIVTVHSYLVNSNEL